MTDAARLVIETTAKYWNLPSAGFLLEKSYVSDR